MDFISGSDALFLSLSGLLEVLPAAIANSNNSKPPVLLRILHSMTQYMGTLDLVAKRDNVVKILISCVASSKMSVESVRYLVESLSSLLEYDNGQYLLAHSKVFTYVLFFVIVCLFHILMFLVCIARYSSWSVAFAKGSQEPN